MSSGFCFQGFSGLFERLFDSAVCFLQVQIPSDLISIREAAAIARVNQYTIRRLIAKGKLDCWGFPGTYRVSLAAVLPKRTSRVATVQYPQHDSSQAEIGI